MNFDALTTEALDPRYEHIDTLEVAELAVLMNEADQQVPLAVRDALAQIVPAIEAVSDRMSHGGRLIYVGAGTPGRIGILDASEIPPTFSERDRVIGIMAGGPGAIVSAVEGAEDDPNFGAASVDEIGAGSLDSVIGIAASGRTPFVIGAIERARERGALTVGLSCNENAQLSAVSDHAIEVVVGPEIVSGSTRLKAGTAQKLVLNMFSTIAMVRLGKTYGNLMVDVNASNEKLRERAVRLVTRITGASREASKVSLEASGYSVPLSVLILQRGLALERARATLANCGGNLRIALESTGGDGR